VQVKAVRIRIKWLHSLLTCSIGFLLQLEYSYLNSHSRTIFCLSDEKDIHIFYI